ncbi:unnamed protein product, partial [Gulo gulo]
MLSTIYKIWEMTQGLCLEVEGRMVRRTEGNTDDSLIGGNASTGGSEGEGTESPVTAGGDTALNHHLQKPAAPKKPTRSTSKITSNQSKANLKNSSQK